MRRLIDGETVDFRSSGGHVERARKALEHVRPLTSDLLVRQRFGALCGGNRIHEAELENIAVRIVELPLVHEAVVRGGVRLSAARGDAGGRGAD